MSEKEDLMEFLVEFEVDVPEGTPESEVEHRSRAQRDKPSVNVNEFEKEKPR